MPVRKIPISHNSITGRFSLGPGKGSVGFESTLERDFVCLMAFDPDVIGIEEQPVRIEYEGANGRKCHYTPDYLVQRRNAPMLLVEIKPRKFLTPDLEPKFAAARTYAAAREWVFEVWTEKNIRIPQLHNYRFLLKYREITADPGRAARILRQIEDEGPITVEDLLEKCWKNDETERAMGLGVLWNLVANGSLCTNFNQELNMESILARSGRTI